MNILHSQTVEKIGPFPKQHETKVTVYSWLHYTTVHSVISPFFWILTVGGQWPADRLMQVRRLLHGHMAAAIEEQIERNLLSHNRIDRGEAVMATEAQSVYAICA